MDSSIFGVIANMLGVLLGAAIAFGTSWHFAKRRDRDSRLALAYALFFRAGDLVEGVFEVRRVVRSKFSGVLPPGVEYKWQLIPVPAGFVWQQEVAFEPSELALLAQSGEIELINHLTEIARGHNILHILTGEYARRRDALQKEISQRSQSIVTGTTVFSAMPDEDVRMLAPEMMLVDDLIAQIILKADDLADFARPIMEKLGPQLRLALNDDRFRGRVEYGEQAFGKNLSHTSKPAA